MNSPSHSWPIRLICAAAMLAVVGIPLAAAQPGAITENTAKLLDYANRERQARGVASLTRDSRLDAIAQAWAEQLAGSGGFSHNDGRVSQIHALGYASEGENLSQRDGSIEANAAHNDWMGSDGHRQNLLDVGFQAVGFGMACSTASGRVHTIAVANFAGNGNRPSGSGIPPATPHVAGSDPISTVVDCNNDAAPTSTTTATTSPLPPPSGQQPLGPPLGDASTTVPGTAATTSTTAALASGSTPTTKRVVTALTTPPLPAKSVKSVLAEPTSVPLVNLPVPTYFPPNFATSSSPQQGNAGQMQVALGKKASGGPHPMVTAMAGTAIGIAGLTMYGLWRRSHPVGTHARRPPRFG